MTNDQSETGEATQAAAPMQAGVLALKAAERYVAGEPASGPRVVVDVETALREQLATEENLANVTATMRRMHEERDEARAALARVRGIHERGEAYDGNLDYCKVCVDHEGAIWPCPTIRAIGLEAGR